MKDYILCDLLGPGDGTANYGLCNQLFQIAALTSHAYDNNLNVSFPQLKNPFFGNYTTNILCRVNIEDVDSTGFQYIQIPYGYHELPKQGKIIYKGYLQSEKYFVHNRELILKLLAPTQEIQSYIESKYGTLLKQQTLAIHVRRGDYVKLPNHHPTLPVLEYYYKAISDVFKSTSLDQYVFFSDDIEWCKDIFGIQESITYIEQEPDYIDLYLMSMCTHNIIANSTFSWWGAWLNKNSDKIIVAPNKWFGPARNDLSTVDLIPETWIKI